MWKTSNKSNNSLISIKFNIDWTCIVIFSIISKVDMSIYEINEWRHRLYYVFVPIKGNTKVNTFNPVFVWQVNMMPLKFFCQVEWKQECGLRFLLACWLACLHSMQIFPSNPNDWYRKNYIKPTRKYRLYACNLINNNCFM